MEIILRGLCGSLLPARLLLASVYVDNVFAFLMRVLQGRRGHWRVEARVASDLQPGRCYQPPQQPQP